MGEEDVGAHGPGEAQGVVAAGAAVEFECSEGGLPKVFVEDADRGRADDAVEHRG